MSKAVVREADYYCDDQRNKREYGRRSWEACMVAKEISF